jgi:hypothetical protein
VNSGELSVCSLGYASCTAEQTFGSWSAGDPHDDPLAGLPALAAALSVSVGGRVDLVGHPQQGQLTQGREVLFLE